jgi:hypothetical protein
MRRRSVDVHAPVALDVEHALDVENVHLVVPPESHGTRALAEPNAVVEEFEVDALVGALRPGEEKLRHARVRLDAVREGVVDRLVAAHLQPALPRTFDEGLRRRDHEEEINDPAEAREQITARFVRIGREAVEAEAVDE